MRNNIKKVLALMLALVVLIACTACNNTSDPADTSSNTENTSGNNDTATDGTTTAPEQMGACKLRFLSLGRGGCV